MTTQNFSLLVDSQETITNVSALACFTDSIDQLFYLLPGNDPSHTNDFTVVQQLIHQDLFHKEFKNNNAIMEKFMDVCISILRKIPLTQSFKTGYQ